MHQPKSSSAIQCFLYGKALETLHEDCFIQRLRKSVVIWGLVLVFLFGGNIALNVNLIAERGIVDCLIAIIPSLVMLTTAIMSWIWMRNTGTISDKRAFAYVLGTAITGTLQSLITYQYMYQGYVMVLVVLSKTLDAYNTGFRNASFFVPFSVHQIHATWQGEVFVHFVGAMMCLYVVSGMVYAQQSEYKRTLRVATVSRDLARSVTSHLAQYNTSTAEQEIRETMKSTDDTERDDVMCQQLLTIVQNMEAYRPFLPNYLLHSEDEECNTPNYETESAFTSLTAGTGTEVMSIVPEQEVAAPLDEKERMAACPSAATSPAHSSSTNPTFAAAMLPGTTASAFIPVQRRVSLGFLYVPLFDASSARATPTNTVAAPGGTPTHDDSLASAATNLVDRIHIIADGTSAVVHGFYADIVTLSWNTARR
eukprot:PhM_4_TR15490/c1_g1_i4/m.5006